MNSDNDKDKQVEPLCKFGPGGDFISVWPTESAELPQRKGKLKHAVKNSEADKSAYAAPATVIKSDSYICGEPMLFADDWRIGVRDGHKSKHRIRTYRRIAKKRPALGLSGQGSLFETNFKIAKTA